MLRTNLSTRPFYNVRAVRLLIGGLLAIVVVVTLFNVIEIVRLSAIQRTVGANAAEAESESVRLREDATRLRAQVDPKELEVVAEAAREANSLIDRRVFSWSDLFTQFEATLPDDVRITQVEPRIDEDRLVIGIAVEARTHEGVDAFIEALEKTGAFYDVLPAERRTTEDGLIEAVVEGRYVQPARETVAAAEPDADTREGARQ
jgi:hypothetical protein